MVLNQMAGVLGWGAGNLGMGNGGAGAGGKTEMSPFVVIIGT